MKIALHKNFLNFYNSIRYLKCISIFFTLLIFFSSCDNKKYKILSNKNKTIYSLTVNEIIHALRYDDVSSRLKVDYKPEKSVEENLQMLVDKEVDFVITQNDVNFDYQERLSARDTIEKFQDQNIRVATSLYPEILFILYSDTIPEPESLEELLTGRRVHLGNGERSASVIMSAIMEHFEVDTTQVKFVDMDTSVIASTEDNFLTSILDKQSLSNRPDVVCYLTNIADPFIAELLDKYPLKIFNFDKKNANLNSSRVAGFTNKYTAAFPYEIPVEIISKQPKSPVATLAINAVLLTRTDVSKYLIYDLVSALHREKNTNLLLSSIDESQTLGSLYYSPHRGTLDFYNQDHPTFIERYGRTIAAFGTVLLAGITALFRWRNNRRFNRIKRYYTLAVDVEKSLSEHWHDIAYLDKSLEEALDIKESIYDLLADGKLEVNLNFLAFQEMIDSLIDQINVSRQNAILVGLGGNMKPNKDIPTQGNEKT